MAVNSLASASVIYIFTVAPLQEYNQTKTNQNLNVSALKANITKYH